MIIPSPSSSNGLGARDELSPPKPVQSTIRCSVSSLSSLFRRFSYSPTSFQRFCNASTASPALKSITNAKIRARSICLKKPKPRPLSKCASSMRPGMSATVKLVRGVPPGMPDRTAGLPSLLSSTTVPMTGDNVVKAQSPTRVRLLLMDRRSVLLPAFGSPTSPTSASSFNSSSSLILTPSSPLEAYLGLGVDEDWKCGLPRPPIAPAASSIGFSMCSDKSNEIGAFGSTAARLDLLGFGGLGNSMPADSDGEAPGYNIQRSLLNALFVPSWLSRSISPPSSFNLSSSSAT